MDNVSGFADKSDDFANFLTVFIQFTWQDRTDKWYFHRQKSSIFLIDQDRPLL